MTNRQFDKYKTEFIDDGQETPGILSLSRQLRFDDYFGEMVIYKEELTEEEQGYIFRFAEKHDLMYNKMNDRVVFYERPGA